MTLVAESLSSELVAKVKRSRFPRVLGTSTGFESRNSVMHVTVIFLQKKNGRRKNIGASKTKYNNRFLPTPYVGHLTVCFKQKIMKME